MGTKSKVTLEQIAKNTRMVIHGGNDYYDEKPKFFAQGHPILSIEMANKVVHFKCTSINAQVSKTASLQDGCYMFKDPYFCQLNQTSKAVNGNKFNPIVDLNHSIYLLNDETPPLYVYDKNTGYSIPQTRFNLSQRDKVGILTQMIHNVEKYGYIRKAYVTPDEVKNADMEWNQAHPNHHRAHIQVASKPVLSLDMEDLKINKIVSDQLFE